MEEENKITDAVESTDVQTGGTAQTENENIEETITMKQSDFDKQIQSAADKVRTEYSKRLKDLEAKIKELTPVEKSAQDLDYEQRLAALEAREAKIAMRDNLTANGIDDSLSDYLSANADIEAFAKAYKDVIEKEVVQRIQANGYMPSDHKAGQQITPEEFAKMGMAAKEKLFAENPDLYRSLVKGR